MKAFSSLRPLRSLRSLRLVAGLLGLSVTAIGLRDARANTWPPAPGANMTNPANWPNDPDYTTTWNFFSWLPKQDSGTPAYTMPDQLLGASGMSVDRAWTYTIGDPRVKIAIIDSGIEWDSADIINKVFLNAAELSKPSQLPEDAMGMPCGGTGALKGYDCDGDGVFTMNDYANDPRMTPIVKGDPCFTGENPMTPGSDRQKGDVNHNCYLDPGDLIELFSDGVDDDHNGYIDDIAGWDFFKNDNDPYDDTRYGHGTGEAHDSSAQGNNMLEGIGSCPNCRFTMLRAGNSFIADVNDFAKAVIYATDNGASVIQEALGTVNQNSFSHAAIDYAYGKNVTVIASMADENSRHHNMPATANHTLPVHAIVYNGGSDTSSSSFLAYNTCTNFGGQTGLAIPASACSSEATGKDSGFTGLLYSYAMVNGVTLTAEEVMQIEKQTADVINVPDSRSSNPDVSENYYESLPWFSQRFGYGRPNGLKAMEAIKSGLIPPEVEIVSPAWFDTLYENGASGPVPLIGRVVAARATSYDYVVEWAPGVEQADGDSEFQPLGAPLMNVPGKTVSGGPGSPLAMIDPSQIDTAHTPDPDSPHHENDRTITLRIQVTAHYPGGDAKGEARRSIAIVNAMNGLDPDLLPGFPIKLNASGEGGPKLADIDGDGIRDIVTGTSDGAITVYSLASGMPVPIAGFPVYSNPIDGLDPKPPVAGLPSYLGAPAYVHGANGGVDPGLAHETIVGAPAIADVNGDGQPDIAFSTWSGTIHIVDSHGNPLPGWPVRLPMVPSCPLDPSVARPKVCMDLTHDWARGTFGSPVLVDMDGDGKLELIQTAFDGNIYIFHDDGTPLAGWPVAIHSSQAAVYKRILTTPAVADYNGDGIPDLVTGSNERTGGGGDGGPVFIVDGRGMKAPTPYLHDWPLNITSLYLFPVVAEGIDASPAAVDMNMDGVPDALMQGNGSPPVVVPSDPGAQQGFDNPPNLLPNRPNDPITTQGFDPTSLFGKLSDANRPDTMFPVLSQPAVGDLDQDGIPDVVMSGGSLSLAANLAGGDSTRPFQHLLAMWSGASGHMFPGSPVVLEDYTFFMSMAVADIGGPTGAPDGYPESILGTGAYFVHAVDACGRETPGWPKFTDGWLTATPAVGDVTGAGNLDVVTQTRDGWLYAWKTTGTTNGVVEWESFHHDNANTGNYNAPLDQGGGHATAPLDLTCPAPPPAPAPKVSAGGGCAVAGHGRAPGLEWAAGAVYALCVLVRRRRRAV